MTVSELYFSENLKNGVSINLSQIVFLQSLYYIQTRWEGK